MAKRTYFEALKWASLFIQARGLDESAAQYLMLGLSNLDQTHLLLNYRQPMPATLQDAYKNAIQQYGEGVPPQYLLGKASFYGREFVVNSSVLIPRQETEELVDWVLTTCTDSGLNVLDVGTGSGAIGLTLKAQRPDWQVTLSDLSPAALEVARTNASQLALSVQFAEGDLLTPLKGQPIDVIVSNPPYIAQSEKVDMDQAVLKSEPQMALFADHDGLAIYERLAAQLKVGLLSPKHLFLEFGFKQRAALTALFTATFPTAKVESRQDIAGHDRMLHVQFE